MVSEINAGRPLYYWLYQATPPAGHTVVCDGYRNGNEIHLNLGWSGSGSAWYNVSKVSYGVNVWTLHTALYGILPLPPSIPAAPGFVAATDDVYTEKVRLTWRAVSGATSYKVYRNTGATSATAALIGNPTTAVFDDTGASAGRTYYYWVKASNSEGNSTFGAYDTGRKSAALPLEEALDTGLSAWSTGGSAGWSGRSTESFDGIDAARSGAVGHSRESWVQTTVSGPRVLAFWWKVSSQEGHDALRFYVDGVEQTGTISGEVGWQQRRAAVVSGTHVVKWAYVKDASGSAGSDCGWLDQVTFESDGLYLSVDLAAGSTASNYPVAYFASASEVPGGVNNDVYRTSRLLMRRLSAGSFAMGSPPSELGRDTNESLSQVSLTEGYYMGVYEVTQEQWSRVMGTSPSYFTGDPSYAAHPLERVSYDAVRGASAGADWPSSSVTVDAASFVGRLRERTGLSAFDLPTEAQWEYACRAGSSTAVNTGKNLVSATNDSGMSEAARYWYTAFSTSATNCTTSRVGSYLPNAWGLYDMHGNVAEWCRDGFGPYAESATNPVGAASDTARVSKV